MKTIGDLNSSAIKKPICKMFETLCQPFFLHFMLKCGLTRVAEIMSQIESKGIYNKNTYLIAC